MAAVVELNPRAREEFTSSLGMIIFLASWAMLFCALFFSYAFVRARQPVWPPIDAPPLPIVLPLVNTVILLVSSFTLSRGLSRLRRGDRGALTRWVAATIALGAVFLALQIHVWQALSIAGLHVEASIYASMFYSLTIFHGLHVAVGLLVLLAVFARSLRGGYTEHNYVNVRLCAFFWHFVDIVWIIMFVSLYLL